MQGVKNASHPRQMRTSDLRDRNWTTFDLRSLTAPPPRPEWLAWILRSTQALLGSDIPGWRARPGRSSDAPVLSNSVRQGTEGQVPRIDCGKLAAERPS